MDTRTTILDAIKARLDVAPGFVRRYSADGRLSASRRYQLATADDNSAAIVYGVELADLLYHAPNDLAYLVAALEATERNAEELRRLLDQTRDEWIGATERARAAERDRDELRAEISSALHELDHGEASDILDGSVGLQRPPARYLDAVRELHQVREDLRAALGEGVKR